MWGLVLVWLTAVITPVINVQMKDNNYVKNPGDVSVPQIIDYIIQREMDHHSKDNNQYTVGLKDVNNKNKKVLVNIKKNSQQTNDDYNPTRFKIKIKRKRMKKKSSNADKLNSNGTNLNAAEDDKKEVTTENSNHDYKELFSSFSSSPEQTIPYTPALPEEETHTISYQVYGDNRNDNDTQSADSMSKGDHNSEGHVLVNSSSGGVVMPVTNTNGRIEESMSDGEFVRRYVQTKPHKESSFASMKTIWKNELYNRLTQHEKEKNNNQIRLGAPVFINKKPASLDKQIEIFEIMDNVRINKANIDRGVKTTPAWEIRESKQWSNENNTQIEKNNEKYFFPNVLMKICDVLAKSHQSNDIFLANNMDDLLNVLSKLKESVPDAYLSENKNHVDMDQDWDIGKYKYINDTYGKWVSMQISNLQSLLTKVCVNLANSITLWQRINHDSENIRSSYLDNLNKLKNIFLVFSKYLKVNKFSAVNTIEDILENAYRKRLNQNQPIRFEKYDKAKNLIMKHDFVNDYKNDVLHQTALKNSESKSFKKEDYNEPSHPIKHPESFIIEQPKIDPNHLDSDKYQHKKPKHYESNSWVSVFDPKTKIADDNLRIQNMLDWSVNEPMSIDGQMYNYKLTRGGKTWSYMDSTVDSNHGLFPFLRSPDVTSSYQLQTTRRSGNINDLNVITYSNEKSKDSYEKHFKNRDAGSFKNSYVSHLAKQPEYYLNTYKDNIKLPDVKFPIQSDVKFPIQTEIELDKLSDTVASVKFYPPLNSIATIGQSNDYLNENVLPKEAANKTVAILGSYILHNTQTSSDECIKLYVPIYMLNIF